MGGNNKNSMYGMLSIADWSLNQHYMQTVMKKVHESELNHPLLEDGMARCHALMWEYGVLLEDGPIVQNVTCLPDEAYFHLGRNRNKGLAVFLSFSS